MHEALRIPASKCHDGKCELSSTQLWKEKSVSILYVVVDPAKNVFAVHGVNEAGKLTNCSART